MPNLPYISPDLVKSYQEVVAKSSSPSTAKRKDISLNRFFNWAESQGHIESNPLQNTMPQFQIQKPIRHVRTRTFATIGITAGLLIIVFLLTWKLKFPIPFITTPAQETVNTVTQNTNPITATPAVNLAWNLFAKLKITDTDGQPVVGSQSLNFKLFNTPKGGTSLYTSEFKTITTDANGSTLVSINGVPGDLFFQNNELYLEPQIGSSSGEMRIPVSTANTTATLGPETVPVINSDGSLLLASQSPAIIAKDGNLLIEGQAVTIKAADGSGGNIEINPDANGYANFLFEGNKGNFLNAQAPNLTSGSLYYGIVANNATGYDLIKLQNGSKAVTRFSVDALGNTYTSGNLSVAGQIATGGTTRLTSGGQLTSINGYSQDSGNFTVTQGSGNSASIVRNGTALNDVLTLTLNETGQNDSLYSTLTLNRSGGKMEGAALKVNTGNAIFNGQIQLGRFVSNPGAIGQASLIYNTTDNQIYFYNGSAWVSLGTATTTPFSSITSGTNTSAAMIVGSGASLSTTGTGTINASSLIGATWAAPGTIGSTTPNSGAFTTLSASGATTFNSIAYTWPGADAAASGYVLSSNAGGSLDWVAQTGGVGGGQWTLGTGILYPNSQTVDVLIGADSTASAKFAFTGVNSGTPNININNVSVLNATTLGTNVVSSSLTTVGALASGSIASGFGTIATANTITGTVVNGTTGVNTGATAGTQRIDASGNLTNIGTTQINSQTYTWPASQTASGFLQTNGSGALSWTTSLPSGTTVSFDNLTSGTNTSAAMVVGTGASLTYSPTGTINASSLESKTWEVPGTIGSTTPNTGAFTTLSASSTVNFSGLTASKPVFTDASENLTSTGTVPANQGGTGFSSYTVGDILYSDTTSTLAKLSDVATGNVLISGGVGTAPGWGKVALGTYTTGDYVATISGTTNQIGVAFTGNNATVSIPSDFRAPGTINAVNGLYTGATAGTQRIDATGNLINILNISASGYATISGSLALGSDSAPAGPGNLNMSGNLLADGTITGTTIYQGANQVCDAGGIGCPAGASLWVQAAGAIYPVNNTVDLLLGSSATASAKFAFTGVSSGTPTATIAGSVAGVATYLTGNGNLATTNMAHLTIGGAGTGGVDFGSPITSGTWNGGTIAANYGGTGFSSYAVGDMLYADTTSTLAKLADVAVGNVLISGGIGMAPNWNKVTLGTQTTGNYVATITGTANQITASTSTGDITLSIPSDFRAPGTVNAVTGVNTGATAGTQRIDASGNLTNIGTTQFNTVTYTWPGSATAGYVLQSGSTGAASTLVWVDPAAAIASNIYWTSANGALFPKNNSLDVLIGADSTTSAKFAFTGVNTGGTPTASISGTTAGVATYLTGEGVLSTTNAKNLTLGSSTTGNIVLNSRGVTSLTANGANLTGAGTYTFPNANTLTGVASYLQNSQGFSVGGGTTYYFDTSGNLNANTVATGGTARIDASGNLVNIGTTQINGTTYTWPASATAGYVLQSDNTGAASTLSWVDPVAVIASNIYWTQANGVLFPKNNSVDVLIGSDATTSAKFAFTGVNGGLPTASIAGSLANIATYITGNGNLQVTNMADLNLGGATTGRVVSASPFVAGSITDTGLTISKGVFTDTNNKLTSTGILGTGQGGTGLNSYTTGDLIYANAPNTLTQLADVATGNVLISGGIGVVPSWGKVVLGTHTTGNYVSQIIGTVNQITASAATGDVTLSIPADFRAPGTVNAVNGLYTGATAGTQRIDASGNLINIVDISASGYATISGSLALGNTTAGIGPGHLNMSGNLVAGGNITGVVLNGTTGINTGAGAGTARIDANGNLTAIGTTQLNGVIYTWPASISSNNYVLQTQTDGTLAWIDPAAAIASGIYWTSANGALFPKNNSLDVLIGADSTASAKFAFTGVNTGATPTASISGTTTGVATYLTGNGNLATTNMQPLTIGGATTGNITLNPGNAAAGGYVAPNTTNVSDLGTASLLWRNIYGTTIYQGTNQVCDAGGIGCPAGALLWAQTAGSIYPVNNTVDLLIGSNATASAKFAFINVLTGTPTASISGSVAGNAVYLTGDGTLATTLNRPLILNPTGGNVGIGTTAPNAALQIGTGSNTHTMGAGDAFVTSDLELDGILYLDGGNISNSAGTGTILFSATPTTTPNTLSAGSWLIENTANLGQAALMVNQLKGGDIFTASASGVPKFTITNAGVVNIAGLATSSGIYTDASKNLTSTAPTSGQLGYWTRSGTNLYNTNQGDNVGIGTTAPGYPLDVNGAAQVKGNLYLWNPNRIYFDSGYDISIGATGNTAHAGDMQFFVYGGEKMRIQASTGNVGIGTTSPGVKLDVKLSNTNGDGLRVYGAGNYPAFISLGSNSSTSTARNWAMIADSSQWGSLEFRPSAAAQGDPYTTGTTAMLIDRTGNIGIGTTNPLGKLDVNGTIFQRGSSLHADYVFEPTYSLESINDHATYMWENKHLKTVPAIVTDANGQEIINWGETNRGILEELEKAHIYIAQLNNQDQLQQGQIASLSGQLASLLQIDSSCVTGDTLLPIRRRKKHKKGTPNLEGDGDSNEFDYLLCRIDEILPGDEVLSLNEFTGALQYARINALKDMAVQEVYELTTKSGRVIRTTANHPYLTLIENSPVVSEKIENL